MKIHHPAVLLSAVVHWIVGGVWYGAFSDTFAWVGLIAATQSLISLFEARHPGLYLLNIGYQLMACGAVSAILVTWRPRAEKVTGT